MLLAQTVVCILSLVFHVTLAIVYDTFESLPAASFDFVVVGGGAAGNVIGNRLSENPNINVLLIESGPSNTGVLNSIVPFFATQLQRTAYDWNFTTTPQKFLDGRVVNYPRGKILGGSTSMNAMFYTRGSSEDFDRFATVTGDSGWSWDNLQRYIRKNERWTAPADHHNTTGQFDPSVHGFDGVNAVSLSGFSHPINSRVIQTTVELPDEFPFNLDMNSGTPLGVGWLQSTIKHGERSSSATSYLAPKFINRKNLHVLLHTRVIRLLRTPHTSGSSQPHIRTVEFVNENSIERGTSIIATKEVILSAGTIGTPHILMHSGIGDPADLKAQGILPIVNLPDVGRNLSDQPKLTNIWFVNSNDTLDNIRTNATLRAELLEEWEEHRMGPFVDNAFTTHIGSARIPADSPIFQSLPDPSAGKNTPHYELLIGDGAGLLASTSQGHFMNIGTNMVTPSSRGSVSLGSANPFDQPLIDPAYLSTEFDRFAMREAVKSARRFLTAPVWKDYVIGPAGGLENATNDELLDDYIRRGASTSAHPVGTAAMAPKGANYGVVDPDLRVKRISGLRIVDASVMPFVTCGHTQAPVYLIAERAADLIKEAWKLD